MKKTNIAILLIFIIVLGSAFLFLKDSTTGKTAPQFTLPTIDGKQLNIADYEGKLVLLNFWASWCPPCRAEIPAFIKIQDAYKDKNFTIVGVAIEDKQAAAHYAKEIGINYPIGYGIESSHEIATQYGDSSGALPYSVLISPEQKILFVYSGVLSEERLIKTIEKHL